ncbi:AMP nucleosidase [Bradyrhizobium canariense]|uniref:AMP nucleosidase n=1 Tax=Bradyrhizobium canariense TaxID=255045 RepID=UPI000A197293|nr:AMP nucleosidase [Bradyrhizobium canariense]OSI26637.1 AMP nucleosidase [Bradyrhizobium canariense]OSI29180.1 AMP nucleosidase [Bradyrhizobium canariense]OSI44221.1 AMP nucleosidase [Bradyrhizobium canariense]OSI51972.1 AMP nucleosidase [Bradyrhizobium canariense]OSI54428.1 AMP nucleosidase [Bradyrhizobium canariense]
MQSPPTIATESYSDAGLAVARLEEIYERNTKFLRDRFEAYVNGELITTRVRAFYPFVRITTATHARLDSRLAYGFVARPGVHETSVTRPDLFRTYLTEQIGLLIQNHGVPVEIGESSEPIPVHFAYRRDINIEAAITTSENSPVTRSLRDAFDVPDLATMDDAIADGTFELQPGAPEPLSLFRAARVDYSLRRLYHYTGTDPEYFQNFVIFTNYQFYVDAFAQLCQQRLQAGEAGLDAFVAPGNVTTRSGGATTGVAPARTPQMPAFHLAAPGYRGITLINIGTGPSNARNVTDHVAVLRPHAWLMLGHCAGLRNTQRLGDYVLAHGYVREDHVLDRELPLWVPIPALAEMQVALEEAVEDVTGLEGFELKRLMRTGTVASVDNRNWEISGPDVIRRLSQSRAVALDMESAAIAANGYRFRVPYGTLLCVSDKPLHGEIKLAGMASEFYRRRVGQHLEIGLKALERLKQQESERLHSRKLRSFAEVAFQ